MRRAAHPKSAKKRSAENPKQKRKAENGAGRIPPLSEKKPAAVQTGTPTPERRALRQCECGGHFCKSTGTAPLWKHPTKEAIESPCKSRRDVIRRFCFVWGPFRTFFSKMRNGRATVCSASAGCRFQRLCCEVLWMEPTQSPPNTVSAPLFLIGIPASHSTVLPDGLPWSNHQARRLAFLRLRLHILRTLKNVNKQKKSSMQMVCPFP